MNQFFTTFNSNPFSTFRTVQKDGRDYLVVNGVSIVEGVLNNFLVTMDEFGAFEKDWDGVPLVLRHPKQNNGSARVPDPDVPIIGRFFGASLDPSNRRMTGEYWFDKDALLSFGEGQKIYENILAGKVIEQSTGYYANIEDKPGVHAGTPYTGIQHDIHPDHIAILPDEIGACSIRDGCGVNRNSSNNGTTYTIGNCEGCMLKNMTGNLPAEGKAIYEKVYKKAREDGDDEEAASKKAWGACKKAGYHKQGDKWVKKNYAIYTNEDSGMDYDSSSMIAYMLPESLKAVIKEKFPFIQDDVLNDLHLTIAYLGDTANVDTVKTLWGLFETADYQPFIEGKVQGMARFISGDEQDAFVLTFDSPQIVPLRQKLANTLDWRGVQIPSEHGFIPHITLAYIGKDDDLPINTFESFDMTMDSLSLVNGNEVLLTVPLTKPMMEYGGMAQNHFGPGKHKSGTDQSVHGKGGGGKGETSSYSVPSK